MSYANRVAVILCICSLLGCNTLSNNGEYYAPVSSMHDKPSPLPVSHIVNAGDSIYMIAWKYGLDYKQLAQHNGIKSPFIIKEGQKLKLNLKPQKFTSKLAAKPAARVKPRVVSAPTNTPWIWPANGKIARGYSEITQDIHKGIDIVSSKGSPIFAAEGGKVVYSGSALRGYGNLIIIKHNENFLSAYAHNDVNLVQEGSVVKKKQKLP